MVGAVISSQKLRKRCTRSLGALPATIAALIAPMEIPGGSLALIVGYQTRVAAALLAAFSIAAAFAFHNHFADQNQFIHFFKNVAMAGGLLQVVAFGAGRFSLDARRG
jgi:putative oxidoreductase